MLQKLRRFKRQAESEDAKNKENLIKAYGMAEKMVNQVDARAAEISFTIPKIEDQKSLENVTDPTIFHAIFLSGKDDRNGDLVNRLASINVQAMKLAQKQKTKHILPRLEPSARQRELKE